jgi:hypothetical protein
MISLTWMLLASLVISVAFLMQFPFSFFSKIEWCHEYHLFCLSYHILSLSWKWSNYIICTFLFHESGPITLFFLISQLHSLYLFLSWKWSNYIILSFFHFHPWLLSFFYCYTPVLYDLNSRCMPYVHYIGVFVKFHLCIW